MKYQPECLLVTLGYIVSRIQSLHPQHGAQSHSCRSDRAPPPQLIKGTESAPGPSSVYPQSGAIRRTPAFPPTPAHLASADPPSGIIQAVSLMVENEYSGCFSVSRLIGDKQELAPLNQSSKAVSCN